MGVKIRPITSKDIRNTYGEVRNVLGTGGSSISNTVESSSIFGNKREFDDDQFIDNGIYTRRGYIDLAIPYVNRFLAGDQMSAFKNIYGSMCKDIADGNLVYSISQDKYFKAGETTEIPYTKDFLIGGDLVKYIVEHTNIEDKITEHLIGFAYSCMPNKIKREYLPEDIGDITNNSADTWIYDDYYFKPAVDFEVNEECDQRQQFKDEVEKKRFKLYDGYLNPMLCMLAVKRDESKLKDQIQKYMIVLPYGYRPELEKRDKLTLAYNKVVKANNDLSDAINYTKTTVYNVLLKYKDLLAEIRNVTLVKGPYESKQYRPILDLLNGKEGHYRDKMQGVRIDYSGRTVIIVDPYMSLDTIGLPVDMAIKMAELDMVKIYNTKSNNKCAILNPKNRKDRVKMAKNLLNGQYIIIGRQPTLYMLGMQGYKIVVIEGKAIKLNPLICPAFNADFDGDQMHAFLPLSKEAREEVKNLVASVKNSFLPRNGECHIAPRQELIYGLWKASTAQLNENSVTYEFDDDFKSYFEVLKQVNERKIDIHDEIKIGSKSMPAGYASIVGCLRVKYSSYRFGVLPLTTDESIKEKPVSESWFKEIIKEIILNDNKKYVGIVNDLVQLGFSIANEYAPNISILNSPDVTKLKEEFERITSEREELFNIGLETEESYSAFYSEEYAKLEASIKAVLKKELANTGYMDMVESGARGSISNLVQMFGMKGRVMKNDEESFNAIIPHSMSEQLTGLEHMVTAYGSRQGLVDKVINTFEPGYLSRKMGHADSYMSIVDYDCGTTDGFELNFDNILPFISQFEQLEGEEVISNFAVKKYITQILVGRYIVGFDQEIRDIQQANEIYDAKVAVVKGNTLIKHAGVKLRSPLTCKNPCCVKCYGRDLSTNTTAIEGLNIGFIAAQSIGQPGTQLTMKNFQSGGVAGAKNLTSSFDKLGDYLELYDLKTKADGGPISYDFISPVEGDVRTISHGDGTMQLHIMNTGKDGKYSNKLKSNVFLYDGIELKPYVKVGDSIQKVRGDLNIREILKYRSADEAQRYYALVLYDLFKKEVEVDLKHFETMVAGATSYICLKGNSYFKTGLSYTIQEYYRNDRTGCIFKKTVRGIKQSVFYRNDLFASIFLEDQRKAIVRNTLVSGYDSLTNPIVRTAFGLGLGTGTDVPHYLERRGNV